MYNLIACQDCNYSEELQIVHSDGVTCLYICHNENSREFGVIHAWFYECRLRIDPPVVANINL